jgi:hypothetical protein
MTKLEELKAALAAADARAEAAYKAAYAAYAASVEEADAVYVAYRAELKKHEENSND